MKINNFKSRLRDGGARPNQFEVSINFPSATGQLLGSDDMLLVSGAALPASTVNPVITQFRGREVKMAGERIFDPWTITVVNSADFKVRHAFEQWMEKMNNKVDNSGTLAPEDYWGSADVFHLDRNDNKLTHARYKLEHLFPINMSEVALQYAQNDIIEEFTVTFQYSHYTVV